MKKYQYTYKVTYHVLADTEDEAIEAVTAYHQDAEEIELIDTQREDE